MNPYNEFPDRVNVCIEIVDELGGEKDYLYKDPHYTIEDQVWEIAKERESMPNFNNIYYGIVFSELESLVDDKYPELEIEFFHNVNDIASDMSFKVKGDSNYTDITDKDEFFDKLAEIKFDKLKYGLNNTTAERALDTLIEAVNDKESIALNYNGSDLIQVVKHREAFQIANEIYDHINITYKDEMLELLVKPEKDEYGEFDYKVVRIDEVPIREAEAIIDTDIPYAKIGVDDINLSVKDEVLQKATEFMDKINQEHSLLLNDTSAMENLRKDNKSVIYDSFTALDDENAEFIKTIIELDKKFKYIANNKTENGEKLEIWLKPKSENEYSVKIIKDLKEIHDEVYENVTTYGGDEVNLDFVIHNDKIMILNVDFPNDPFKSSNTFDDKGIANLGEQNEITKKFKWLVDYLQEKYEIKNSVKKDLEILTGWRKQYEEKLEEKFLVESNDLIEKMKIQGNNVEALFVEAIEVLGNKTLEISLKQSAENNYAKNVLRVSFAYFKSDDYDGDHCYYEFNLFEKYKDDKMQYEPFRTNGYYTFNGINNDGTIYSPGHYGGDKDKFLKEFERLDKKYHIQEYIVDLIQKNKNDSNKDNNKNTRKQR